MITKIKKLYNSEISNDTLNELQEQFSLRVTTTASGVTLYSGGVGSVTINDNDPTQPTYWICIVPVSNITEGTSSTTNTTENIAVNLGTGVVAGQEITVEYSLSSINAYIPEDVKLADSAPGRTSDTTGTITFAKDVGTVNIPIEVIADDL